jgi:hypothetical protein
MYIHTYILRFIHEGVAETSQIHQNADILPKVLAMRNTADVTGGKLVVHLRCECY